MAVFIFISFLLGATAGGENKEFSYVKELDKGNDLLLKKINIKVGESQKEMIAINWLVLFFRSETGFWDSGYFEFKQTFKGLVNEDNPCLTIEQAKEKDPVPPISDEMGYSFLLKYDKGGVRIINNGIDYSNRANYKEENALNSISYFDEVLGERIYVSYYYGKCLERTR
jgi:hypothetical protein